MKTLVGACGNDGCLDCPPASLEVLDDEEIDDGKYAVKVLITSIDGQKEIGNG